MVTFKLVARTDTKITYHYYPQGREDRDFGIISIDLAIGIVILEKLAVDDSERVITKEELNEMRDSINSMRLENGEKELSEDELPIATEDVISRYYADHAMNAIFEAYKKGSPLESGIVKWY